LKIGVFEKGGPVWAKIPGRRGRPPPTRPIFARIDSPVNECLTTSPLTVFTQRKFVADFLLETENDHFAFLSPFGQTLGGIGATFILGSLESVVVDFLLVIMVFFLRY